MRYKNETRKIFELGKVALSNPNRKSNMMELDVSLRERSGEDGRQTIDLKETPEVWYEFSASGGFWNNIHTNYIECGQCLDTMIKFQRSITPENRAILKKVFGWWNLYHLNDMNAGTRKQTEAVEKYIKTVPNYDYTNVCEHLKSIGLYEDNGYKYGHGWLVNLIPDDVLAEMKKLVGLEEDE